MLSWFLLSLLRSSSRAALDQLVRYLHTHQMKHDLLLHWPVTMLDWMVRKKTGHTLSYILTSSWFITDEACIRPSFHCMMDLIALLKNSYFLPNDCRDWYCSLWNRRVFVNNCMTELGLLLNENRIDVWWNTAKIAIAEFNFKLIWKITLCPCFQCCFVQRTGYFQSHSLCFYTAS